MTNVRRAVIDVGTNSVKLLIADVVGREVRPVLETGRQTRLGRGFYADRQLQPEPIAETARVAAEFVQTARAHGAGSIRAFATSAAREARNADELVTAIAAATGLQLEIISGEQEADWAFRGATTDPRLAVGPLLLLDVGGGSAQFILGCGEQRLWRESFPLGAVRLLEQFPVSDPPRAEERHRCESWVRRFLAETVIPRWQPAREQLASLPGCDPAVRLVGTGGTAMVLARMEAGLTTFDRERIEATPLPRGALDRWVDRLWQLPLAERRHIPGLPPDRADIILTGALVYQAVLGGLAFDALWVSTRGLRFAALLEG